MDLKNPLILASGERFASEYETIYRLITEFDRIAVVAHTFPDFDALGTSYGLYDWLITSFPNKEVIILGEDHHDFSPSIYPMIPEVKDAWFEKDFLAIIVDTANTDRVGDKRALQAKTIVKIDHHPAVEQYGTINLVATDMVASSQLVVDFILNTPKYDQITKQAAIYFYSGIVGDSGRFKYASTSPHTFAIASELIKTNFDLNDIYNKMYILSLNDLYLQAHILQNFSISKKGVAYYIVTEEEFTRIGVNPLIGKSYVNIFSDIRGVPIWFSVTEDSEAHVWRISLRSKGIPINGVATKYNGGGHAQASGCQVKTLDELNDFIADLEALIE